MHDALLELAHRAEMLLVGIYCPEKLRGTHVEEVNRRAAAFVAAWKARSEVWNSDTETKLAARYHAPREFRAGEVVAGCWARLAADAALGAYKVLSDAHRQLLGRWLVANQPRIDFGDEHIKPIADAFRAVPALDFEDRRDIRKAFAPLIIGLRQEQAWLGENAPETQLPCNKGVSLRDAAERIRPGDPEGQTELIDKWRKSWGSELPAALGKCPDHKQRNLYEPAAFLAFLRTVEGDPVDADFGLSQHFMAIARPPRAESQTR